MGVVCGIPISFIPAAARMEQATTINPALGARVAGVNKYLKCGESIPKSKCTNSIYKIGFSRDKYNISTYRGM